SGAATTSTIGRSTLCVRLGSTPRAPPSRERPVPRPILIASRGAWSWTGDGLVSWFRCNDGDLDEGGPGPELADRVMFGEDRLSNRSRGRGDTGRDSRARDRPGAAIC